jgi:hypothetical protein
MNNHHMYSSYEEKSMIQRTIQYYIKDRTESFDNDYFPCSREKKSVFPYNKKIFIVSSNKP